MVQTKIIQHVYKRYSILGEPKMNRKVKTHNTSRSVKNTYTNIRDVFRTLSNIYHGAFSKNHK